MLLPVDSELMYWFTFYLEDSTKSQAILGILNHPTVSLSFELSPVIVTTRITSCLVGGPYKDQHLPQKIWELGHTQWHLFNTNVTDAVQKLSNSQPFLHVEWQCIVRDHNGIRTVRSHGAHLHEGRIFLEKFGPLYFWWASYWMGLNMGSTYGDPTKYGV